jgi:hypothetical protein
MTLKSIQSVVIPTSFAFHGIKHLKTVREDLKSGVSEGSVHKELENFFKIEYGNFLTDGNLSNKSRAWQLFSRHTWEGLQTSAGNSYSQVRNVFGKVDRVDYLGGATFVTNENASGKKRGISFGNFINLKINDEITGGFEARVLKDPLFMHEYGHYIDSQDFGGAYLLAIGTPSLISALNNEPAIGEPANVTTHDFRWYEMRANRNAARYFGVSWSPHETNYPRKRR